MSDIMLDMLGPLPCELVCTYAYTQVLTMRSNALFWAIRLAIYFVFSPIRASLDPAVRIAVMIVGYSFLVPFLMSKGKPLQRLFIVAVCYSAIMIAEALCTVLWVAITGDVAFSHDAVRAHQAVFLFTRVSHVVVIAGMLAFFSVRMRALRNEDVGIGARYYVGFPLAQSILLSLVFWIYQRYLGGEFDSHQWFFVLVTLCAAADILLFHSLERCRDRQREEQRLVALAQEIEKYYESYTVVLADIEHISQLRHDIRNQIQVVEALVGKGEYDKAREHLSVVLRGFEDDAEGAK